MNGLSVSLTHRLVAIYCDTGVKQMICEAFGEHIMRWREALLELKNYHCLTNRMSQHHFYDWKELAFDFEVKVNEMEEPPFRSDDTDF